VVASLARSNTVHEGYQRTITPNKNRKILSQMNHLMKMALGESSGVEIQASQAEAKNVQSAAGALGLRLLVFNITTDSEIAAAFATLVERQAGAVFVSDSVHAPKYDQIMSLAGRYALPTMFAFGELGRRGGCLSYGPVLSESIRQAGAYTGRILKGEKPADLPVQQATRFEFIINLKTARAIRLEIPPLLLALADEVIE